MCHCAEAALLENSHHPQPRPGSRPTTVRSIHAFRLETTKVGYATTPGAAAAGHKWKEFDARSFISAILLAFSRVSVATSSHRSAMTFSTRCILRTPGDGILENACPDLPIDHHKRGCNDIIQHLQRRSKVDSRRVRSEWRRTECIPHLVRTNKQSTPCATDAA